MHCGVHLCIPKHVIEIIFVNILNLFYIVKLEKLFLKLLFSILNALKWPFQDKMYDFRKILAFQKWIDHFNEHGQFLEPY